MNAPSKSVANNKGDDCALHFSWPHGKNRDIRSEGSERQKSLPPAYRAIRSDSANSYSQCLSKAADF
jgi:hypothetical protein